MRCVEVLGGDGCLSCLFVYLLGFSGEAERLLLVLLRRLAFYFFLFLPLFLVRVWHTLWMDPSFLVFLFGMARFSGYYA